MNAVDAKSSWPRRLAGNLQLAIRLVLRPSRGGVRRMVRRSIVLGGVIFAAVFLLTLMLFDLRIIAAARDLPPGMIAFTRHFTDLGKAGIFLYPLPVLMIVLCLAPSKLPRPVQGTLAAIFARATFVFFAIGIPYGFNGILKQVFGRARPLVENGGVYIYEPFTWGSTYASLPSGHAVTAFAAAVAIGALYPRARLLMWVYAVLIAVSRVVVTAHHPSDVLAGALVGTCGALLVRNYFASRRIVFGVTAQGVAMPFAGPSWRRIKSAWRALMRG